MVTRALPLLERFGLVEGERKLLLDGVGVLVAPEGDVSPENRVRARQDVDIRDRCAHVDQSHDAACLDRIVRLERVLEGKGVHVDQHRVAPGLGDHARVVADLVLLHRDQKDVHRVARPRFEDNVIEVDVVDVERDVLLGLPADRLRQLFGGHRGKADLLDDDGVARKGGPEVLIAHVRRRNEPVDRVDHEGRIHDRPIDNRLRREGFQTRFDQPVAPALDIFQLDQLDR